MASEPSRPEMYDVIHDVMRPVEQSDWDAINVATQVMGRQRDVLRVLDSLVHDAIRGELPLDEFFSITDVLRRSYTPSARLAFVAQEEKAA